MDMVKRLFGSGLYCALLGLLDALFAGATVSAVGCATITGALVGLYVGVPLKERVVFPWMVCLRQTPLVERGFAAGVWHGRRVAFLSVGFLAVLSLLATPIFGSLALGIDGPMACADACRSTLNFGIWICGVHLHGVIALTFVAWAIRIAGTILGKAVAHPS